MNRTVITGTGSYIPELTVTNSQFTSQVFFADNKKSLPDSETIVNKFEAITGIRERRYVSSTLQASDIGAIAALKALESGAVDPESIDQLIVAHNFGNIEAGLVQGSIVPAVSSVIKHQLGIKNPQCVAYDIIFGCPGWLQGVIQAHAFFLSGMAKKALVIGTETLSRVVDKADRDSMIFSDGAGAVVLEQKEDSHTGSGIIGFISQSDSLQEFAYIKMGAGNAPDSDEKNRYIKMSGRKVYEYAISKVPAAIKSCLEQCRVPIENIKKFFIHQANEKMDEAIIHRLFNLYGIQTPPANVMPMSIQWLGNSSVATLPTLLDLVTRGQMPDHQLNPGDIIVFASVGAGMNINAVCYLI